MRSGSSSAVDPLTPGTGYDELLRLQRLSNLLDSRWRIPGTSWRIGLDGIAGLVPGIGDTLGMAVSAYIVYQATRFGVPSRLVARMVANVGVDWLVGSVPVLGSIFDIAFKANRRNMNLLTRHLEQRYTTGPRGA
ncbi:DUF4112 domain-containing protein [Arenibaculum pallidiluteum]|uniref:DUF4112 domain-containing protein n=1 Tax=Arenibaculum pallidiluteum TaxID=2812559 RepID=UPI001A97AAD2|nr:DUF4112 domain-containing protein [Arenibaculum pallidiluteum]